MEKLTTQEFIEKARSIHGDKYDYTKSVYKKANTKITIICKHHGQFLQTPSSHLSGRGCKECSHTATVTTEKFIKRAKEIHDNKYDYSKSTYKNNATKLVIICKNHGEFLQTPSCHLSGRGCKKCCDEKKFSNIEKFMQKAKAVHGDKYDYSKSVYKKSNTKIKIICPSHGEFEQRAGAHLFGQGCKKCVDENKASSTKEFIRKAREIHGDKYDYSKVVYKNYGTKVTIICKHHGTFKQTPQNHLSGTGCPICRNSKGESAIFEALTSLNVDFITEKRFKTCRDKLPLPFDFYIPSKNLLIEYNGEQHYFKVKLFNKNASFNSRLLKDRIKRSWCKENDMTLLVIPYTKLEEINDIILKNIC